MVVIELGVYKLERLVDTGPRQKLDIHTLVELLKCQLVWRLTGTSLVGQLTTGLALLTISHFLQLGGIGLLNNIGRVVLTHDMDAAAHESLSLLGGCGERAG